MKQLTRNEVRRMFIEYFKAKDHMVEPSAPLVPIDDDSLLWINSGVATLKKYFDGRVNPENPRITNAQKSIRTNDIENVGFTARHHTFFEMLGNFSIGDYYKKEAIEYAWEFLTSSEWIEFDADKLYVTIHPEDEEAYSIWKNIIGLDENRIIRMEGNFWDIGEGPCGPQTEIFYDRGEDYGINDPKEEMFPGGENERYLEIWNLVFSEFNHNKDGSYTPLPKKNIDTGMGLERMTSIVQEVPTNFDTDLFMPIIEKIELISGFKYREDQIKDVAFKVISDHIRTVSFAISDGALPSNEGRGYVLRRLIRRAIRFSKELNINTAFLYQLVDIVAEKMYEFYPNVMDKKDFIRNVIQKEEERFLSTLDEGLNIYEDIKHKAKNKNNIISGEDAFKLYDTYGFPYELTLEYAEKDGLSVDKEGFDTEMKAQQERARKSRKSSESMQVQRELLSNINDESTFIGYDTLSSTSKLLHIIKGEETLKEYDGQEAVELIFEETPFYATSGGQVADLGMISNDNGTKFEVTSVYKAPNGQHVHIGYVRAGILNQSEQYHLNVDRYTRTFTTKNHTATHLLHQALKDVLGGHVNQAGSLVESERLRFDFSHLEGLKANELTQIENIVNEKIFDALDVNISEMDIDSAKEMGAMALFGEKYGKQVRVVNINNYSIELCGGIHVNNTSEIGVFKIVSESGIGAGVRRIEAVTSKNAINNLNEKEALVKEVANTLKVKDNNIIQKLNQQSEKIKNLEADIKNIKQNSSGDVANTLINNEEIINEISLIHGHVENMDNKALRELMDTIKSKKQDSIIALVSNVDEKVSIVVTVPKPMTNHIKAGEIVKGMAEKVDGKGGGRPDMAQGGGTNVENISVSLQFVKEFIKSINV